MESSAITVVLSLAISVHQKLPLPCDQRGLQASSSTGAAHLPQWDCKGGSMKNTSPFPEGCVGGFPCCLSQPGPPVAFPADRSWEQHTGAVQAPPPHWQWGGTRRLQLTHGGLQPCGTSDVGTRVLRSLGKAWQGCWTCPAHARDRGSSSRLLSGEGMCKAYGPLGSRPCFCRQLRDWGCTRERQRVEGSKLIQSGQSIKIKLEIKKSRKSSEQIT